MWCNTNEVFSTNVNVFIFTASSKGVTFSSMCVWRILHSRYKQSNNFSHFLRCRKVFGVIWSIKSHKDTSIQHCSWFKNNSSIPSRTSLWFSIEHYRSIGNDLHREKKGRLQFTVEQKRCGSSSGRNVPTASFCEGEWKTGVSKLKSVRQFRHDLHGFVNKLQVWAQLSIYKKRHWVHPVQYCLSKFVDDSDHQRKSIFFDGANFSFSWRLIKQSYQTSEAKRFQKSKKIPKGAHSTIILCVISLEKY